ncbi:glucokinase [Pannus brasiliensis CCIBt3594]|uniref:Glucokinase n=1 Tax=Pannus brasiliensis CCIBt3594 TaxID=1427578 RepID=A0AAW9QQH4_9CHRO
MAIVLAGDIGGTKTILRLAESLLFPDSPIPVGTTLDEETYPSQKYPDLVPMVRQFLARSNPVPAVEKACFGIAGPVVKNASELTNLNWSLSADRLSRELQIDRVELINDFAAIGYGVLGLAPEDVLTLQEAPPDPNGPIAVIGAGTGLGEGFLTPLPGGGYQVFGSEGSHADFAPRSTLEFQLARYLLDRFGLTRVSIERVVSGSGIAAIYQFLREHYPGSESPKMASVYRAWCEESGNPVKSVDLSAQISLFAREKSDNLCEQTMKLFIDAYGAEAGNLALKLLPYGGLFVAGGIVAKNIPLMTDGTFIKAFLAKGRMSQLLTRVPVYLVKNPKVGLIGATLHAGQL